MPNKGSDHVHLANRATEQYAQLWVSSCSDLIPNPAANLEEWSGILEVVRRLGKESNKTTN